MTNQYDGTKPNLCNTVQLFVCFLNIDIDCKFKMLNCVFLIASTSCQDDEGWLSQILWARNSYLFVNIARLSGKFTHCRLHLSHLRCCNIKDSGGWRGTTEPNLRAPIPLVALSLLFHKLLLLVNKQHTQFFFTHAFYSPSCIFVFDLNHPSLKYSVACVTRSRFHQIPLELSRSLSSLRRGRSQKDSAGKNHQCITS